MQFEMNGNTLLHCTFTGTSSAVCYQKARYRDHKIPLLDFESTNFFKTEYWVENYIIRNFKSIVLTRCWGVPVKDDKIGEVCSIRGSEVTCMQIVLQIWRKWVAVNIEVGGKSVGNWMQDCGLHFCIKWQCVVTTVMHLRDTESEGSSSTGKVTSSYRRRTLVSRWWLIVCMCGCFSQPRARGGCGILPPYWTRLATTKIPNCLSCFTIVLPRVGGEAVSLNKNCRVVSSWGVRSFVSSGSRDRNSARALRAIWVFLLITLLKLILLCVKNTDFKFWTNC